MSHHALIELCKKETQKLTAFNEDDRRDVLVSLAQVLLQETDKILFENNKDIENAKKNALSPVIMDRLLLDKKRISQMSRACQEIAHQKPVLGFEKEVLTRPSGITVKKQRIPLGLLAMVFESRPNVIIDAMALCIKSGNGLILKGGKEAYYSNRCLFDLASKVFEKKFHLRVFHYIDSREEFHELLKLKNHIDLVIARGGSTLVEYVKKEATMPVMSHDKGLCHTYIHHDAQISWVNKIVMNAKLSRPSVCNALESLLIHTKYQHSKSLVEELLKAGVEIRGCEKSQKLHSAIKPATDFDFDTEYLDKILSCKIVEDEEEALKHILKHTSHHTEGVITQDPKIMEKFFNTLDSSCIVINSSTRFNDGGELGLGAELGISTSKFHAYGPVGAEQMTAVRFVVEGMGAIRE